MVSAARLEGIRRRERTALRLRDPEPQARDAQAAAFQAELVRISAVRSASTPPARPRFSVDVSKPLPAALRLGWQRDAETLGWYGGSDAQSACVALDSVTSALRGLCQPRLVHICSLLTRRRRIKTRPCSEHHRTAIRKDSRAHASARSTTAKRGDLARAPPSPPHLRTIHAAFVVPRSSHQPRTALVTTWAGSDADSCSALVASRCRREPSLAHEPTWPRRRDEPSSPQRGLSVPRLDCRPAQRARHATCSRTSSCVPCDGAAPQSRGAGSCSLRRARARARGGRRVLLVQAGSFEGRAAA